MNNILILNKETYELIQDKVLQKQPNSNNSEFNQNLFLTILELIKDLDQISNTDYYVLKFEGKTVLYRKSKETKLAILIIVDKKAIKKQSLIDLSKVYMQCIDKEIKQKISDNTIQIKKTNIDFRTKEFTLQVVEDLTIKFVENLRKNKLYAKFVYYNYNPSVSGSISYKKSKIESTSVILYNSNKEHDRM